MPAASDQLVYVGTYTAAKGHVPEAHGEGIAVLRLAADGGAIETLGAIGVDDPSYLALAPDGLTLYGVTERADETAAVWAYALDPRQPTRARPLGRQPIDGGDPCHVALWGSPGCLAISIVNGGRVEAFPLAPDGAPLRVRGRVVHRGRGAHPVHQAEPHPHAAVAARGGRLLLVADRGTDRLHIHGLDGATGRVEADVADPVAFPSGSGPRHVVLAPGGRRAYVCCELGSLVGTVVLDDVPRLLGVVSTLPDGFAGANLCAEVHAHPSGRWVHVSNRWHDSIACFAVVADAPGLVPSGHADAGVRTPRGFALAGEGRLLVAAGQDDDRVVVHAIDPSDGLPRLTGAECAVATPVCVAVAPTTTITTGGA